MTRASAARDGASTGRYRPARRTRDQLVAELARLAAVAGAMPAAHELVRHHPELVAELEVYFESLDAACRAATDRSPPTPAPVPAPVRLAVAAPPTVGRPRIAWTRAAVVDALRSMFRAARLYHGGEPGLVRAAEQIFGSFARAVEAISTSATGRAPITADDVIAVVRKLAEERPGMTARQFERTAFAPAIRKHFGGLEAAARAAGLASWPPLARTADRRR